MRKKIIVTKPPVAYLRTVRKKILLADDHPLILEGLAKMLASDYEVLEPVSDGRTLLRSVADNQPDVVIADISMPLLNGLDAAAEIVKAYPRTKVIILTMYDDVNFAARAFNTGAAGYLLKSSAGAELKTAVMTVLSGDVYIPPSMAASLLHTYRGKTMLAQPERKELTHRQREVLQLLAEGKTAAEAGNILHLSPRTVEFHKYRIMETLGIDTNADLLHYAIETGLVVVKPTNPTAAV